MARIRKSQGIQACGTKPPVWYIAAYIRLSKDDGSDESLSITNQKKIIGEHLEHFFEGKYSIVDFYIDDGLTGTDYERPDFQRLMHDVEAGKVNCVICKNLSRAFRNYSDQGYFLESYFPLHNTRFITLGDPKVDSFLMPETIQNLEVPITGLMNDRFACKTSNDVRDTFNTKRRNGEFIGAFAPYGYEKDAKDKNRLVTDDEAADIVRAIFTWFTQEGLSKLGIAKRLNEMGVPNPTAYKRRCGLSYCNPYGTVNDGLWSASTITRILKNKMYLGHMVQGRQRVISYKVHERIAVAEAEWFIKENTHEPLVSQAVYDKAQSLQERDTRTAPSQKQLYVFSGFLRCADCNKALTRKTAKNIVYYSCRTYNDKLKTKCTKHAIREDVLENAVLTALRQQIALVLQPEVIISKLNAVPVARPQLDRLEHLLTLRTVEIEKLETITDNLYMDWKSGDLTRDEYSRMKAKFEAQAAQLRQAIQNLREEIQAMRQEKLDQPCLASFLKYGSLTRLERGILAELVDTIYVHDNGAIRIAFNFTDPYKQAVKFIESSQSGLIPGGNEKV